VPIKAALLSQRAVAGVGNIYADEALWRARIHPLRPARRLTRHEVRALHQAIREVMAAAVEAQGTTLYDYRTVAGEVGAYRERLAVYGHAGEPCPRCGSAIERLVVGQRGTHACPRCQRRPRREKR
jgi:formamidopyrimidine-DNA glycosylase